MRIVRWMALAAALAACSGEERPSTENATVAAASPDARAAADSTARDTAFTFALYRTGEGEVDSVLVTRGGRRVQALLPSERIPVPLDDDERMHRVDLDFDGYRDFGLMTLLPAAPNPAYDYWRFDPAADEFRYVGNYGMLEPDSAARVMTTHNRGGHAGRLWTNSYYGWVDGELVEVRADAQTFLDDVQRYAHVVYERRGDSLVVVSVDTLEDSEVEPVDDPTP